MPHASQFGKPSRRLMILLVAAAAAALLLVSIPGSARAGTCIGGRVCVWTGSFYTGSEENLSCSAGTGTNFETLSAQNHCGVNVRIGWAEGGTTNWKACMAPGGLRPEPGRFNQIVPNGC
jgi:hypothetical protein